jgi:hypothetical protein
MTNTSKSACWGNRTLTTPDDFLKKVKRQAQRGEFPGNVYPLCLDDVFSKPPWSGSLACASPPIREIFGRRSDTLWAEANMKWHPR